MQVLVELIAACPGHEDLARTWELAKNSALPAYQFSMGLQELIAMGFYEAIDVDGFNETWTGIKPTSVAYSWARAHQEGISQLPFGHKRRSSGDDIPF